MKRHQLLFALHTLPLLGSGQGHEAPVLRFASDGTFKISVYEDLHFGEDEFSDWAPAADAKSVDVLSTLLDAEAPDLAVLNGDLITGENTHLHNSTHYVDAIVAPLVARSVPWASTYGNHDLQFNLSTRALLARERFTGGALSFTRAMVPGDESVVGTSNYYLPVYAADSDEILLLLWFFDSKGGRAFQRQNELNSTVVVPSWVDDSVTAWFRRTHAKLQAQYQSAVIPSLAFVHIPTHASLAFQQAGGGVDPRHQPGINDDNPASPQAITCTNYTANCSYSGEDSAFMRALVTTEGLLAVFSGHDHGNDWCFRWASTLSLSDNIPSAAQNNMSLCFGRHTGYGGYGNWTRGARQIALSTASLAARELETWVRLEDGSLSGHVMLNETYGEDWYPIVEDERQPRRRLS